MGTAIVIVIIVVICVFAIYSYGHKMRRGGGCCGSHEAAEKKVKVADKNKDHYPYEVTLTIDGMTCSNCSRRVENALNSLDGVWAKVDLGERKADVRLKQAPDNDAPAPRRAGCGLYGPVHSITSPGPLPCRQRTF
ncbi:MAG: heavy-metal-associated domain-containing protein [Evtepia sp.]